MVMGEYTSVLYLIHHVVARHARNELIAGCATMDVPCAGGG